MDALCKAGSQKTQNNRESKATMRERCQELYGFAGVASRPRHSYSWLSRRLHGESGISFKTDMFKNYMFNKILELLIINDDITLTIPS